MKFNFVKTRTGIPALWESGGGYTNTGDACVICDKYGNKKPALYHATRGHLACGEHALVPVGGGDFAIFVDRSRHDLEIKIYSVGPHFADSEWLEKYSGELTLVAAYRQNWSFFGTTAVDIQLLTPAIDAAVEKSKAWHCREAVYVR